MALEIRSRRVGFAVLQGANLLDWGQRGFPPGISGTETAIERISFLLDLYAPAVVIARRTRHVRDESSEVAARIFRKIRGELKRRSVRFVVLARRDVREFFSGQGCRSKQEIAAVIADRFDQLKSRLPRRRRAWERERHVMAVFDAIATAVVFNAGPIQEPIADG
ncbi:MAG TPA: hypothetical protein VGR73_07970 [Bryobacteraceae bacterium]|nr:hypothetical protein [Bryobacteraceae bacterium]